MQVDGENPYWISFSDLMSALLVIFILASVALMIELSQAKIELEETKREIEMVKEEIERAREEIEKAKHRINLDIAQLRFAEKARRDIIYEVRDVLAQNNITVMLTDNDTVIRIPESTLTFESNSYDIPDNENLINALGTVGSVLHQAINKPLNADVDSAMRFEYLDTVFIEGHTDSVPTARTKGNWGLSSFRAISIWEFWETSVSSPPKFSEMENAFGQKLFSLSGYADTRRLEEIEETPGQRQRNRRIDIRFTVKRPSLARLEEIITQ